MTPGDDRPTAWVRPVPVSTGSVPGVNSSIARSLPVKFVGALIALIGAGIVLYLIGVLSMYMIAWAVQIIEWIFG